MPIFKKKSDDVLDLTAMQRRGLMKVPERRPVEQSARVDSSGWVDYSRNVEKKEEQGSICAPGSFFGESSGGPSQDAINQLVQSQSSKSEGSSSGVAGFFGATQSQDSVEPESQDSGANALGFLDSFAASAVNESSSSSNDETLEIQGLKNKIEDLEYKLRVLEDKIAGMGC